ncbi:thermonuclease family protein [Sphingomonas sp. S-NIH.Pt3_0716]|nr:thermonuclease family protein [Sphingomonas sp. S-NIH.Pt3_0716]
MFLPFLISIFQPPTVCVAIDDDTLKCSEIGRVRLLGIDAPELPGPCRKGRSCAPGDPIASKKQLVARGVTISPVTRDRYGRTVTQVYAGNKNLAYEQLRAGRAVYVEKWSLAAKARHQGRKSIAVGPLETRRPTSRPRISSCAAAP